MEVLPGIPVFLEAREEKLFCRTADFKKISENAKVFLFCADIYNKRVFIKSIFITGGMNMSISNVNGINKYVTEYNDLFTKSEKSSVEIKKSAADRFEYSNIADIAEIKTGKFELRTIDMSYTGDFYELSDEFKNQDNLVAWMKAKSQSIIKLGIGCANGVPSSENIAKYFGDMSKRLDEAYAEGRFTDEEYDKMNTRLNEYIEETISSAERTNAFYALGRERGSHASRETLIKEQIQTPEEFREDLNNRITEYVEKVCKYDRDWIFQMINNIRYGVGTLLK